MVGQTLGHYKILELLGKGGMGEVYRAEDTTLDRQVALKVLLPEVASDPDHLARFEREAKTLAALDHPNIVTIHSVEEAVGVRFLTMQLVEGKSLSELIPRGGMPVERIFDIAIPLADALAAAHEKGVIHRDLKPGNVMVTDEGRVKVLDFGLAKLRAEEAQPRSTDLPTHTLTEVGTVVGTVPYMSPEQLEGKPVDARSDLFSLGVILYEIATGRRPFRGVDSISLIFSIAKDTPVDVDELRTDLPHHLGRIIRRCLEKNPEHRFQTAKDVRNELEDLAKEATTIEAPATVIEKSLAALSATRRAVTPAVILLVLLAVTAAVFVSRQWLARLTLGDQEKIGSLAVLPLRDISGDPAQEYFAEGMTEALITSLSKIRAVKVISRTSVMQYRHTERPLPEIAEELGVDALVEGSVLQSGNQVRITAQLIDGRTDEHLWAESYTRELEDVLALHSEVAQAIAREIRVSLAPDEVGRLTEVRRVDPEAYRLYLLGEHHREKRTRTDIEQSIEYFRGAIAKDPHFPPAYNGLFDSFGHQLSWGWVSAGDVLIQMKEAVVRALELDESSARSWAQKAYIDQVLAGDFLGAEAGYLKALELAPNDSGVHTFYAEFLLQRGEVDHALLEISRALELNPLSLMLAAYKGEILGFAGRFDQAGDQCSAVLAVDPEFALGYGCLGGLLLTQGRFQEAVATYRTALELSPRTPVYMSSLAYALAQAGNREEAKRWLVELETMRQIGYAPAYEIAVIHAGLDDSEQAFWWLAEATQEAYDYAFVLVDRRLNSLRDDPRFPEVLAAFGLTR